MILSKDNTSIDHINSITHDGKVLVFAISEAGVIYYTVRADGFENNQPADQNWGNWEELPLPWLPPKERETTGQKEKGDASVRAFEEEHFTAEDGTPLLRSRYHTKGESVIAPVQLISDLDYLYVFRQSKAGGYLWVDRFVLDGMNNRLIRKLEVRYKRNKQKYAPLEAPSGKANIRFDSLHFRDADGIPFYEPTIELNLQATMANGWFSVVLLPTDTMDEHQWHFFFHHSTDGLDYVSIRASSEGLFDLKDRTGQPGFELRNLQLNDAAGQKLAITGAPVATKYDQQAERVNQLGDTHLVRTATKVLLVVPTDQGAASLDFSVAANGRLSYLSADAQSQPPVLLSGKSRTLQLPLDTLEDIKAYRSVQAPATGRIIGMEKEADGNIRLRTGKGDPRPTSSQILIKGTQSYNGLHKVASVDGNSFEIEAALEASDPSELRSEHTIGALDRAVRKGHTTLRVKESLQEAIPAGTILHVMNGSNEPIAFKTRKETSAGTETIWIEKATTTAPAGSSVIIASSVVVSSIKHELGEWEEAPVASNALTAAGEITNLQASTSGKLKVKANQGLQTGDDLQIKGSTPTDGWYDVLETDKDGIVLDAAWEAGKVINRSIREYRGIQMPGGGERLDIEMKPKVSVGCLEMRFKTSQKEGLQFTFHGEMVDEYGNNRYEMSIQFALQAGMPTLNLVTYGDTEVRQQFSYEVDCADGQWHHFSYVWGKQPQEHKLYIDGREVIIPVIDVDFEFFNCYSIESDIYSPDQVNNYTGQLAELRLWRQPRSRQDIRELLYENLTGREADLVGYWPMGAIADGRKLLDLSENKNHASVTGNVYTPGAQLERDDTVIEFRNETLIAVTQGGAYTESFEYRLHGGAPGEEEPFQFKYRGKRSRNADIWTEQEAFHGEQHAHEALEDGWRRASCSFVVPKGVSLLRAFGIHQLGEWERLEVRNHRIQLTSNSISKQVRLERASLSDLYPGFDDGNDILAQISEKETKAITLSNELTVLSKDLTSLEDQAAYQAERERRMARVTQLAAEEKTAEDIHKAEEDDPFNYWLELDVLGGIKLVLDLSERSEFDYLVKKPGNFGDKGKFAFVPSENRGYFLLVCKAGNHIIKNVFAGELGANNISDTSYNLKVKLDPYASDEEPELFRIKTSDNHYIGSGSKHRAKFTSNKSDALVFRISKKEDDLTCNTKIADAKKEVNNKSKLLLQAEKALAEYSEGKSLEEINKLKSKKISLIKDISDTQLPGIESKIHDLKQGFNEKLAPVTGIDMSQLFQDGSITTKGSLLNFVQASSNLHVLPSANGNIYLSYFDQFGQLQQPYYDVVSDVENTVFEAWVPNSHRLCMDISDAEAGIKLAKPIPLSGEWTIECKFYFPFPEKTDDQQVPFTNGKWVSNVLIANDMNSTTILTQTRKGGPIQLGTAFKSYGHNNVRGDYILGDLFYPCGYDMRELETGWHHLTVVGKGFGSKSNTLFYIDGTKVGDIRTTAEDYLAKALNGENPDAVVLSMMAGFDELYARTHLADIRVNTLEKIGRVHNSINLIGRKYLWPANSYAGKMAEIRVWGVALSPEEIEMNTHLPSLSGREPGLKAYLPLNGDGIDKTGNGYDERQTESAPDNSERFVPYTGDIGKFIAPTPSTIISSEYSTVGLDPITGQKTAMLRRFMAYPKDGGVQLLSQQRIEELELLWIGNAQINPTLLGFIEGAPPVPSENLTVDPPAYQGATSVELVTEEDLSFSWNREDTSSLGMNLDLFVGAAATVSFLGLGGVSYKVGVSGGLALANTSFNQSNIGSSASSTNTDRLELRGYPEEKAHFPHLGPRFVPKNIGYALVASGTADVYITRLKTSKRMIAYTVQPSPDIPLDVNTITFLINPAYTMNGSLDGLTGTRPTSERFFNEVLDMRAEYGSAYPASYYRVEEAYALKETIEKQDKERAAYFANFDIRDLQGNIDRATGDEPEDDAETERIAKEKQAEMEQRIEDEEARAHAFSAFTAWQRKMEDLQIKAGKRNIVNTYVWDADGGLRVEEQQFAGTIEHTVGGSFEFSGALGVSGEVEASGLGVGIGAALTLQATLSMSQTMSKTESSSRALSLAVDLSGLESQGITDFKDNPLMPGEKVDRYRFMSFYLEGSAQHFEDFFNEVVDPEWLAGNDEEARALRQTQQGKPNKTWRVLHRVTYVERPALKGFGK